MADIRARSGGAAGGSGDGRGFTLVELLVVVGIVGLLLAILLPTVSRARSQANNLACQSNLRQIGQAIQIYVSGSKGILPFGYWDGTVNLATGVDLGYDGRYGADWSILLQSAISSMAGATFLSNQPGGLHSGVRNLYMDWDVPAGDLRNAMLADITQYGVHPRLMPTLGTHDKYRELAAPGTRVYLRPYRLCRLRRGGDIALVFDATLFTLAGGGWSVYPVPVAQGIDAGRISRDTYLTDQYNVASTTGLDGDEPVDVGASAAGPSNQDLIGDAQSFRFRHMNNSVCNALMGDMHVQSFVLTPTGMTDLQRQNINVNP